MRSSRLLLMLSFCCCLPWWAGCGGEDAPETPPVTTGETAAASPSPPSSSGSQEPGPSSDAAVTSETTPVSPDEQAAGSGGEPPAAVQTDPGSSSAPDSAAYMNETSDPVPVSEDQGSDSAAYSAQMHGSGSSDYSSEGSSSPDYSTESSSSENYGSGGDGSQGYPGSSGAPGVAPAKPVTLADTAQQMFRQGDDQLAFRYLYGHAVAADAAAAKELLDKMGYSAQVGRPLLGIRWGIGVEYNGPPTYNGNVFPIGTVQEMPGRPSGRAAGGEAGGYNPGASTEGMPAAGGRTTDPLLQKLTGEFGDKVVEQLVLRINRNDYGQVYQAPAAGSASGGGPSPYGSGGSSYDSESGYGSSGYGAASGYPAGGGREHSLRSMTPGLAMIGVAPTKELLAKARQSGLHAAVVFKVAVAPNPKAGLVFTDSDVYLYDVANSKELFRTRKPLRNTEVQRDRAEGKDDGVAKTLVALFETVDQTWRLGPVPELQPEQVLDRIRLLLGQKSEDSLLPDLAEIRMYHSRGLLQDAHLLVAYQRLLGNDDLGRQLAAGSEEERQQIVKGWLNPAPAKEGPRDILQQSGS